LRGNFAAPDGSYYTQFWPSLPGDNDNYLSCGECFQLVRTKNDGTDYQLGETGYTPPIALQIIDSCPAPPIPNGAVARDATIAARFLISSTAVRFAPRRPCRPRPRPLPNESLHLDLSDIAMSRLQTGDPTGQMIMGIPTRYRRVPCPVKGNIHIRVHSGASEYYFALTVVNVSGFGAVVNVETQIAVRHLVVADSGSQPIRSPGRRNAAAGGCCRRLRERSLFPGPAIHRCCGTLGVSEQALTAWPSYGADDFNYFDTGVQF